MRSCEPESPGPAYSRCLRLNDDDHHADGVRRGRGGSGSCTLILGFTERLPPPHIHTHTHADIHVHTCAYALTHAHAHAHATSFLHQVQGETMKMRKSRSRRFGSRFRCLLRVTSASVSSSVTWG